MGTTEVQRTIVKSPPELWSELSDQGSLGRLLSDLGEVRIVSTVAESAVYWEADGLTGSALIKQAGWGTKVTLTVTLPTSDTSTAAPATPVLAGVGADVSSPIPLTAAALRATTEPSQPLPAPMPEANTPPADTAAKGPGVDGGEPTRRGFFARLFGRRSRQPEEPVETPESHETASEPAAEPAVEPDTVTEPSPPTALEALQARYGVRPAAPEPTAPTPPTPDLSSELRSAEEVAPADVKAGPTEDQVNEILTGVLDRLGSAHHRPFSRA
ncbi:MAG TPA: hypothetical protein VMB91_08785 [Solirubrobacteraceae bacterium]|nr:hypothetical protein [Solirubrobacteraceae bacterium]